MTEWWPSLGPTPYLLLLAAIADLIVGDPVYPWHPIRLLGRLLTWTEGRLRALGADGYGGGIALFVVLIVVAESVAAGLTIAAGALSPTAGRIVHVFLVYSLLALGDLLRHVWRIETAVRADDIHRARHAVSALVGRDTDRMDGTACRRAAVESLSENLTDGYVSAVCWYVVGGLPGLVLFKVASTMDSMVGYKTPRYLRFGWAGARLDDVMNFIPARLAWLLIAASAALLPGCSLAKALAVGWRQHALLLGPNSGWSEAAAAGALQRRLVGPIWLNGTMVTDQWIGEPVDPPLGSAADVVRALMLVVATGAGTIAVAMIALSFIAW